MCWILHCATLLPKVGLSNCMIGLAGIMWKLRRGLADGAALHSRETARGIEHLPSLPVTGALHAS